MIAVKNIARQDIPQIIRAIQSRSAIEHSSIGVLTKHLKDLYFEVNSGVRGSSDLLFIPSHFNPRTGKILGLRPSNSTSDLTFSRASSATMVHSDGLVGHAPHNHNPNSEDINGSTWTKERITVTTNAIANPLNGAIDADLIKEDTTASASHRFYRNLSGLDAANAFVWVKSYDPSGGNPIRQWVNFRCVGTGYAYFDIVNGVVGNTSNLTASIENAGNGWFKLRVATAAGVAASGFVFQMSDANGSLSVPLYTGNGVSGMYVWGCHFSSGTRVFDYIPTGSAGLYAPRFAYDPSTLKYKGLMIEKGATNLLLKSEEFNDTSRWSSPSSAEGYQGTGLAAVVTANYGTAPDGNATADRVQLSLNGGADAANGTNRSGLRQSITITSGTTYTGFIWLKALDGSDLPALIAAGILSARFVNGGTAGTYMYESYPSGWLKITNTSTASSTTGTARIQLMSQPNSTTNTLDLLAWGYQAETGGVATSYIPTYASTVTKNADVCTLTGDSSWLNDSEGTMWFMGTPNATSETGTFLINISDNSLVNRHSLQVYSDFKPNAFTTVSSGDTCDLYGAVVSSGVQLKSAFSWKANDFSFVTNTDTLLTDASGAVPAGMIRVNVGSRQDNSRYLNGTVKAIAIWKTKISNADLTASTV